MNTILKYLKTKNNIKLVLYTFIIAFIYITICSKCSFIYPFNDWDDVDVYITCAKLMSEGYKPYKDFIYQSGPLTSFLFYVLYILDIRPFFSNYILEIICAFFTLFFGYKTMKIVDNNVPIISIAILGLVYASNVLRGGGGCTEEFALPLLMYINFKYTSIMYNNYNVKVKDTVLIGFILGILFWVKFTLLIIPFGMTIVLLIKSIKEKKLKTFIKNYSIIAIIMILISLIIILILYKYNILNETLCGYLINNSTNYNNKYNIFIVFLYSYRYAIAYCTCLAYSVYIAIYRRRNINIIIISLLALFYFFKPFGYYLLPLSLVFAHSIPFILSNFNNRYNIINKLTIPLTLIITILVMIFAPNTYLLKYNKEDMPQFRFARQIKEDSLQCFTSLDVGFYYLSNTHPIDKYLFIVNINQSETANNILNTINNESVTYVITDTITNSYMNNINYKLIDTCDFIRDSFVDYNETYYLYELKGDKYE